MLQGGAESESLCVMTSSDLIELRDSPELFSIVTSLAGEGEAISSSRRDGGHVFDLKLDNGGGRYSALSVFGLVPAALEICRRTYQKIQQNLFWAFIYNLIGLPLAAFGLLNPVLAGAAMALSSVSVVGNALLLKRWRAKLSEEQA